MELAPDVEPLWKMGDVCRYTGSDRTTIVRWTELDDDPLPAMRLGRTYRFERADVIAWCARRKFRCTSPTPGQVAS